MSSRSKGFTLIEVVIALAVLAIAFFGMISVVTYTTRMNLASQQRTTATRAAEKKIEQMLNTAQFDDIYARFSMIGSTDKGLGWDTVDGLEYFPLSDPIELTMATGYKYPPIKDAQLFVRFPLNAAGNGFSEVGSGQFFGNAIHAKPDDPSSPIVGYRDIDLNGNGNTTDPSVQPNELKILPVIIEVHWKGSVVSQTGTSGHPFVSYRYTFFRRP